MSGNNKEDNIINLSIKEKGDLDIFHDLFTKRTNPYSFHYSYNYGERERGKNNDKDLDNKSFYQKYNAYCDSGGQKMFELEKELAKYIKDWHSTGNEYKVEQKLNQDDFFNEENVLSNILGDQYIKKEYSIIPFELINLVIGETEKKVFDNELLLKEREAGVLLDAPLSDKGFIEFLLNNDIEEKLHIMYQGERVTTGYSYVIEKIVVFDLFLIYIVLKNFPFYVLRRDRLEILFKSLKKYKSFPYPIGSIGMDIFKLLINELYLPGVTILQEVRNTLILDLIDPNIVDIKPSDFIKVVSFTSSIKKKKGEDKKDTEFNNNQLNTNFKLNELKEFTFTCLIIFASYILYSSEDKKDSEKEESYCQNILALFEKKLKQKKDDDEKKNENKDINNNKENNYYIYEKNIVIDIFNLIDDGLDSNYSRFRKEVKAINDKLISKSKESHDNAMSIPSEIINLRKFLDHNIHCIDMEDEIKKNRPIFKTEKVKENPSQKANVDTKKVTNNKKAEKNKHEMINGEGMVEEETTEDIESKAKTENINSIEKIKEQLKTEMQFEGDKVLNDYIDNFSNLRNKYYRHLVKFETDNYNFSQDIQFSRGQVKDFNELSKFKEKKLTELYKQKYIVKEDQLLIFLKNLKVWKCNIKPVYRQQLVKEYEKEVEEKEKKRIAKQKEKKNSDLSNNDNKKIINVLKENLSHANSNSVLKEGREKVEYIVKCDLPFNYELYLIPGEAKKDKTGKIRFDNPLTKFISKQDFIYKSIIGDFFREFFNEENIEGKCDSFIDTPLQLYLKEAQHFYNLKVFQCKMIVDPQNDNDIDDLKIADNLYYIYGSIHIESSKTIVLDLDKETFVFTNEDSPQSNIYIDIINIYNENNGGKINDIEKYLVNPNNNCFQVFVSAQKVENDEISGKYVKKDDNEKKEDYLKKFVVPILNFDLKSMNFEAKKIKVRNEDQTGSFKLTPTFFNITPTDVNYFEINYAPNSKRNKDNLNDNGDNQDLGVYSFDIQIKTFIDLYKSDD